MRRHGVTASRGLATVLLLAALGLGGCGTGERSDGDVAADPDRPCGDRPPAYEDRDQWLADAATFRISLVDGVPRGDVGQHEVDWSQLVQVIVRSDATLDIVYDATGQRGHIAAGGQTTLAFPVDDLGTSTVQVVDAGTTLVQLEASC